MSLTIPFVSRRAKSAGKHRADDRIAEIEAAHEQQVTKMRQEITSLLNFKAAADDYFAILQTDRADVYGAWQFAEHGRQAAEQIVVDQENHIRSLERQLSDAQRRLGIGVLAEAAAAQTQEIPVITRVLPMCESPLTAVDPAQLADLKARGGHLGPVTDPGRIS